MNKVKSGLKKGNIKQVRICFCNNFCRILNILFIIIQGIPTHDASGQELPKSALKKLVKQYGAQEKKYSKYLKSAAAETASAQANGDS